MNTPAGYACMVDHGVQTANIYGSHALRVPMHVNPPTPVGFVPSHSHLSALVKPNDQQGDDATMLLAADNFFEVLSAGVPEPDVREQYTVCGCGGWSSCHALGPAASL